jgi:hypothetical protein
MLTELVEIRVNLGTKSPQIRACCCTESNTTAFMAANISTTIATPEDSVGQVDEVRQMMLVRVDVNYRGLLAFSTTLGTGNRFSQRLRASGTKFLVCTFVCPDSLTARTNTSTRICQGIPP